MTDNNTLAPTDAEILDTATDFRSQHMHGGTTFDAFDEIGFARAVLAAKWGTHAPASSEPAAVLAGMEPVAWLIVRSAFRASPDGQDAEGNEWLEEAQSPEEPGAFAVFTAAQAQDACNWSLMDEDNGVWESACGEAWTFIDGGPQDNNVRFCQGCGKPVAIAAQKGDAA